MRVESMTARTDSWSYGASGDLDVELTLRMNTKEYNELSKKVYEGMGTFEKDLNKVLKESKNKPKTHFGGAFEINGELVYIERVIYNNPAVIVFWSDGTKTKSRCSNGDDWNPEFGLNLAVLKKFIKTTGTEELYRDWGVGMSTDKAVITLKDVRKNAKEKTDAEKFVKNMQAFTSQFAEDSSVGE